MTSNETSSAPRVESPSATDGLASAAATGVALVPRGGSFEGQVVLLGETLIEGSVRGSLRGSGELILGPEARIEGAVECDVVSSRGEIVGPVVARSSAHFGDGARLEGDLECPALEVEGDVLWNGTASVGSS